MKNGPGVLLLLTTLLACGREGPSAATTTTTGTIPTSPSAEARFEPKEAQATVPPRDIALVQEDASVTLVDYRIEMSDTLPASQVTFNISNAGEHEHSFEIEGEGIERKLDRPLKPGQSAKLVADLRAGTYRVYCPVADHEERGMARTVLVR